MGSFIHMNGYKSEDLGLYLSRSSDHGYGSKLQPFQPNPIRANILNRWSDGPLVRSMKLAKSPIGCDHCAGSPAMSTTAGERSAASVEQVASRNRLRT